MENPNFADALNEAKIALFQQPNGTFGETMEMHGIEEDDFMPVVEQLVPFLLQRYGPVNGVIAAIALGTLAGMRMGLPNLDVPDTLPEDFNA